MIGLLFLELSVALVMTYSQGRIRADQYCELDPSPWDRHLDHPRLSQFLQRGVLDTELFHKVFGLLRLLFC